MRSSRARRDAPAACLGLQPAQRVVEAASAQQQQLPIGEPSEVARAVDDAGVDARDLRRLRAAPSTHASISLAVVGDGVPVGRGEDDIQLIEAAEAREERAERRDRRGRRAAAATGRRCRTTAGAGPTTDTIDAAMMTAAMTVPRAAIRPRTTD